MDDAVFMSQAIKQMCGSLDPNTVLKHCFQFLKKFIPMETIAMAIIDPDIQSIENIAFYVDYDPALSLPKAPIDHWKKPIIFTPGVRNHIASFPKDLNIVIINDPQKDLGGRMLCETLGFDEFSYLVLRIPLGKGIEGLISISSRGRNIYTPEHGRLAELLQDPFSIALSNAIQHQELIHLKELISEDNRYLYKKIYRDSGDTIIGNNNGLKHLMETIQVVAKLNNVVMLRGETGVGKEVIANAIHYNSQRANRPLVKINCGAIPETLIDSELFGHEKGAFTGAVASKRGHFERAHTGTLFLDEIGDLPPSAQVRLLRVIQQKELIRVGGTQPISINVRIIVATHRNLEEMVKNNDFRADLWYRINAFPVNIPPLRERREDIPDLVKYFIDRKSQEMNLKYRPQVSPQGIKRLLSYDWPGNVRELENCVERALIKDVVGRQDCILNFDEIREGSIQDDIHDTKMEMVSDTLMSYEELNRIHFQTVLKQTKGRINGENGAAKILKLKPNNLRYKLKKFEIPYGRGI